MLDKVCSHIRKYQLISPGDTVVCGLSGGADSVALLLSLRELSDELGITVEALHVNHCIRGAESDRDQEFCRTLCEKLGVRFTAVSCNVPEYAEENSLSHEEAARKLRYGIFSRYSAGKLMATAHNANDDLETAVLNLIRGTGLKGLAGVPVRRGNIIRPLLCVSRAEIEGFLAERGQDFVTDSTNLSDDYTRNRIRHSILPIMQEINPSLINTFRNSSETLREEDELISALADEAYNSTYTGENQFSGLRAKSGVIRRRCLARLLSENSLPYSRERLLDADRVLMNGGKLNISGDIYLVSDGETAGLRTISAPKEQAELSAELKIGENRIFNDKVMVCELLECDNLKKNEDVHKNLTFYLLDYDKIIGRAAVRNRRFGDRIRLSGRGFTSSVKKLINEKVPQELRSELHFIEDENGTIFAERLGIADRVSPSRSTTRFLKIYFR
jgi:tRNA(Ile)-lysidine synthase